MARYDVHSSDTGGTSIPPKVIEHAVRARLRAIDGVQKVKIDFAGLDAQIIVLAEREVDRDGLHRRIEDALGLEFWINLGMADMGYELSIEASQRRGS